MQLMSGKRDEFFQEMDKQDRLLQERSGAFMLDAMKINPHRVQLFSINEIWQCVSKRLIELRVMKDPEGDSVASDSDSTEVEEDCDFVQVASERVHSLFKGKKKQDRSEKSVAELMRRNDLNLMKRVISKVVEHEQLLKRNAIMHTSLKGQIKTLQREKDHLMASEKQITEDLNRLDSEQKTTETNFNKFELEFFPEYMSNYGQTVAQEVLKSVYKTQSAIITSDMLAASLAEERNTNIQDNINKLESSLREYVHEEDNKVSNRVQELNDRQTNELIKTNQFTFLMNEMVLRHEENFVKDEQEPKELTEAEMEEKGYHRKHGVVFDMDDQLVRMTKKQLQKLIFKLKERQHQVDDQVCGIEDSLHM